MQVRLTDVSCVGYKLESCDDSEQFAVFKSDDDVNSLAESLSDQDFTYNHQARAWLDDHCGETFQDPGYFR